MKNFVLAPLANRTIRAQAADLLRSSILEGRLPIGARIVERNLAQQLGTSLTAVREALIQLESEGLIVKKPNSTTHVISLEPAEIDEIFDVRAVLECYAFELAARAATPAHFEKLEELEAAALKAARELNHTGYWQIDLEWHDLVWRIPGKPHLYASLRRLVLPLFVYRALHTSRSDGFDLLADGSWSHRPLLEALRSGNALETRRVYQAAIPEWRSRVKERDSTGRETPAG